MYVKDNVVGGFFVFIVQLEQLELCVSCLLFAYESTLFVKLVNDIEICWISPCKKVCL